METTQQNVNSSLFLDYLIANGFNPNNYNGILELGQSAPKSLSQFLTMYQQYLLSIKVIYHELEKYRLDGAFGYVQDGEIFVPKTLDNDQHFLHNASRVPYKRHGYNYPSIGEFDVLICEGVETNLLETLKLRQDKYFGLCLDIVEVIEENKDQLKKRNERLSALSALYVELNASRGKQHFLIHDEDRRFGKDFYLIKTK